MDISDKSNISDQTTLCRSFHEPSNALAALSLPPSLGLLAVSLSLPPSLGLLAASDKNMSLTRRDKNWSLPDPKKARRLKSKYESQEEKTSMTDTYIFKVSCLKKD